MVPADLRNHTPGDLSRIQGGVVRSPHHRLATGPWDAHMIAALADWVSSPDSVSSERSDGTPAPLDPPTATGSQAILEAVSPAVRAGIIENLSALGVKR